MLTNRKKIKNRKKTIKIILGCTLLILIICVSLGYWLWTTFFSKANYISPLPLVLSTNSVEHNDITNLENILKEKEIEFTAIKQSETAYIIYLKDNKEAIISSEKDLREQISSLQFISFRLTMESRQFLRLDLRYDKPVIVFK